MIQCPICNKEVKRNNMLYSMCKKCYSDLVMEFCPNLYWYQKLYIWVYGMYLDIRYPCMKFIKWK